MTRIPASELRARLAYRELHGTEEGFVPPPRKKRQNIEYQIQSEFMRWWRANCGRFGVAERLMFAVPNGAAFGSFKKDRQIRGQMLKAAGMRPGVPDVFLAVGHNHLHGLFLEFKKPGGRTSEEQDMFIGFAINRGYACKIVSSVDDAAFAVEEYLS